MIEMDSLKKIYVRGSLLKYRHTAAEGVSFKVDNEAALGIIGESGCGKSTVAKMITRLTGITEGRIILDGEDVTSFRGEALKKYRKKVQLLFQNPASSLDPRMTVESSIMEALLNYGIKFETENQKQVYLNELMHKVGLLHKHLYRYPRELSGGQIQRAVLARIISMRPSVLIADEPTSMLDVSVQAQVLHMIKKLQYNLGLSLILISHDLDVIRIMCDDAIVMYRGQIIESAPANELYSNPLHPYTKRLMKKFYVDYGADECCEDEYLNNPRVIKISRTEPRKGCMYVDSCPFAESACRVTVQEKFFKDDRKECGNAGTSEDSGHMVKCLHPFAGDLT